MAGTKWLQWVEMDPTVPFKNSFVKLWNAKNASLMFLYWKK